MGERRCEHIPKKRDEKEPKLCVETVSVRSFYVDHEIGQRPILSRLPLWTVLA